MTNIIPFPSTLSSLSFNELISKSDSLLSSLQQGDENIHKVKAMLDEFSRRLEKESQSLYESVQQLKHSPEQQCH